MRKAGGDERVRARSRSAAVVIFTLASSPATSRTSWPACSASIASSVPEAPPRPASMAAASTSRRNACGVCARNSVSRGSVRDDARLAGRHLLHRVVHRHGRDDGAGGEGAVDGAIDHVGGDERTRRVVHEDHRRVGGHRGEALGDRVLAPRAARHDAPRRRRGRRRARRSCPAAPRSRSRSRADARRRRRRIVRAGCVRRSPATAWGRRRRGACPSRRPR